MSDLRLQVELWLVSLPKWPLALVAVSLTTLALWTLILPSAQREAALAANRLKGIARSPLLDQPSNSIAKQPDNLSAFDERLASPEVVSNLMLQIWKQSREGGLILSKVDYRSEWDAAGRFGRLSMTLPISGTYPAIRKFIFSLMADFPALSLDKLDLKREQPEVAVVESTVHLTLLIKP